MAEEAALAQRERQEWKETILQSQRQALEPALPEQHHAGEEAAAFIHLQERCPSLPTVRRGEYPVAPPDIVTRLASKLDRVFLKGATVPVTGARQERKASMADSELSSARGDHTSEEGSGDDAALNAAWGVITKVTKGGEATLFDRAGSTAKSMGGGSLHRVDSTTRSHGAFIGTGSALEKVMLARRLEDAHTELSIRNESLPDHRQAPKDLWRKALPKQPFLQKWLADTAEAHEATIAREAESSYRRALEPRPHRTVTHCSP